jgi:hypothetical protein
MMTRTLKLLAERALVLDMASEGDISLHIHLLCITTELSRSGRASYGTVSRQLAHDGGNFTAITLRGDRVQKFGS